MENPLSSFNFTIHVDFHESGPEIEAGFSECSGLEMTLKPFTLTEGGSAARQIHLPGSVSYGQITLKRGMTLDTGLWDWFEQAFTAAAQSPHKQMQADMAVVMRPSDGAGEGARYVLYNCHPVRLKAPPLDAAKGGIAIEELQVAYEWLQRRK